MFASLIHGAASEAAADAGAGCSMQAAPSASFQIVHGPGDSVGPSLLLQVSDRQLSASVSAKYLFGVSEGLSRGLLEHKARPGPTLRATFSSTLSAGHIGGLGGLLLRLKADGHEKVGPQAASTPASSPSTQDAHVPPWK